VVLPHVEVIWVSVTTGLPEGSVYSPDALRAMMLFLCLCSALHHACRSTLSKDVG
jgi:hypothetical protein